jgi:hypothetical protein
LGSGFVICVNCGLNFATGKRVETHIVGDGTVSSTHDSVSTDATSIEAEEPQGVYESLESKLSIAIREAYGGNPLADQVVAALDDPHRINQLYDHLVRRPPFVNSGVFMQSIMLVDEARQSCASPSAAVNYLFNGICGAAKTGSTPRKPGPAASSAWRSPDVHALASAVLFKLKDDATAPPGPPSW